MNIRDLLLSPHPPAIPAFTFTHDPVRKARSNDKRIATPSVDWKLGYYWHSNHHVVMAYSPRVIAAIKGKIVDTKTFTGEQKAQQFLAKKLGLKSQYSRWYQKNQTWIPAMFDPKDPAGFGAFTGRHIFLGTTPSYFLLSEVLLVKPVQRNVLVWLLIEAPDFTKPIDVL